MKAERCPLEGILILHPDVFADERGYFLESFEGGRYREAGIATTFVQENLSRSVKNVLRGMHFTKRRPQAQIVTVVRGAIFDAVVDVRAGSPTFGKWFGTELSDAGPRRQLYMPAGFAHGFCVLSDVADLHYMVSERFDPTDDAGLRWDDPEVGIRWPVESPIVSAKDEKHPLLRAIAAEGGVSSPG
jgi:dTDP-4-dehydrorhamnose 3,5-epimerase